MWDYHTEATKTVKLVLGMIQSLLKLVTISAFIAQPFLTLSSVRNTVLEHLKSLVGACKEPQAKQVCAVFTRGTEAPCVILVQSTWQEAACFPRFGGSAGHCPVLQPLATVAGTRAAAQDHRHLGYAAPLSARGPRQNVLLVVQTASGFPDWRSCGQRAG